MPGARGRTVGAPRPDGRGAEHRGRGHGATLLAAAHALAAARGAREVEIHAQLSALGFWERAGYTTEGPGFEEAGIPHVAMRRAL